MDDLIAFNTARLDEDEHRATAEDYDLHLNWCAWGNLDRPAPCDCGNPARVLREVAAKRLALDLYEEFSKKRESLSGHIVSPAIAEALRAVIRADAAVWSYHPDYRQEWAD